MKTVLSALILVTGFSVSGESNGFYQTLELRKINGAFIPSFTSQPYSDDLPKGSAIMIAVHGAGFEARHTFDVIFGRLRELGLERRILLIAPQFFSTENRSEMPWVPNLVVWLNGWWRYGSIKAGLMKADGVFYPSEISSFDVMDELIEDLIRRHKGSLRHVILFGFSAGGQFVQRYALYGSSQDQGQEDIQFTYIPSSPASYMFLTGDRPNPCTSSRGILSLSAKSSQDSSDLFPYGMKDIDATIASGTVCLYFKKSKQDKEAVRSRYARRNVRYFVGSKDETGSLFDKTPQAMTQGDTRVSRAQNFMIHLQKLFPKNLRHNLTVIENAGHDLIPILQSNEWGALITSLVLSDGTPEP